MKRLVLISVAGLAILGAWTSASGADPGDLSGIDCSRQESSRPGFRSDVLRLDVQDRQTAVILRRNGNAIDVYGSFGGLLWRIAPDVSHCSGIPPTVRNIDSIVIEVRPRWDGLLVIDQGGGTMEHPHGTQQLLDNPGGPLAPGATREKHGSEIEIEVVGQEPKRKDRTYMAVVGTTGPDSIVAGSRDGRDVLNLNADADGPAPDADVLVAPRVTRLIVEPGKGDDSISGRGFQGTEPMAPDVQLIAKRSAGNDRLLGHAGRDFLDGGTGNDLIRGGGGNDYRYPSGGLNGGPGSDRVYGGPGNDFFGNLDDGDASAGVDDPGRDRYYGGAGKDHFYVEDGDRDVLECGPGREGAGRFDKGLDVLSGCETGGKYRWNWPP